MKKLKFGIGASALCACVLGMTTMAHAAPGDLDTTFSSDGRATNALDDAGKAIALQGTSTLQLVGGSTGWGVIRYLSDGSVDTTFGTSGLVGNPFTLASGEYCVATAIAVQSDGKFVVAGNLKQNGERGTYTAVARYTANGALDTTFSSDGMQVISFGFGGGVSLGKQYSTAGAVAITSGNKVLIAGGVLSGGFTDAGSLIKLTSSGNLDPLFDTDGKVITLGPDSGSGYSSLAVGSTTFVVAGLHNDDILVSRYLNNGTLDTSFGSGGTATFSFIDYGGGSTSVDTLGGAVLDSSGKIVVAGGADSNFAVARLTTAGALDSTFGTGGKVVTVFSPTSANYAESVQLDGTGKIVTAGYSSGDFAIIRYNSNGTLDTSFSGDGKTHVSFAGPDDGHSVAIQSDGKIVVGGESNNGVSSYSAITRLLGDTVSPLAETASGNSISVSSSAASS